MLLLPSSFAQQQELPPHFCFGMNTLSFLYSYDMKLMDVRSVVRKKLFPVSISPQRMQFLHEQARQLSACFLHVPATACNDSVLKKQVFRVTSAMLDSAFVFVEKHPMEGGTNRVSAYCLSHPSWGVGAELLRQQLQCHVAVSAAKPSYNDTPGRRAETCFAAACSL